VKPTSPTPDPERPLLRNMIPVIALTLKLVSYPALDLALDFPLWFMLSFLAKPDCYDSKEKAPLA
jgi:hypothetical protein